MFSPHIGKERLNCLRIRRRTTALVPSRQVFKKPAPVLFGRQSSLNIAWVRIVDDVVAIAFGSGDRETAQGSCRASATSSVSPRAVRLQSRRRAL
jgi:hypothetical protein